MFNLDLTNIASEGLINQATLLAAKNPFYNFKINSKSISGTLLEQNKIVKVTVKFHKKIISSCSCGINLSLCVHALASLIEFQKKDATIEKKVELVEENIADEILIDFNQNKLSIENKLNFDLNSLQYLIHENKIIISQAPDILYFLRYQLAEMTQKFNITLSKNLQELILNIEQVNLEVLFQEKTISKVKLKLNFFTKNENIPWQEIIKALYKKHKAFFFKNKLFYFDDKLFATITKIPRKLFSNQGISFYNYLSLSIARIFKDYFVDNISSWVINPETINPPKLLLSQKTLKTLRPYQLQGVKFLHTMNYVNFSCLLADEMGLGKTIQTLAFLESQKAKKKCTSLILCPKTLLINWQSECKKFTPNTKVLLITGNQKNRIKLIDKIHDYDLIITSYSLLNRDIKLYEKIEFDHLILDEAQYIKNNKSLIATSCRKLKSSFRLILSGTPLENSTFDLWSLFEFLLPELLGNKTHFNRVYNKDENINLLKQVISPFILRRLKSKVLQQLPKKNEQVIYCNLTEEQQTIYNKVYQDFYDAVQEDKSSINILACLTKLRQVCLHPCLIEEYKDTAKSITSPKLELLFQLVQQILNEGKNCLIFSQFTKVLDLIRKYFIQEKINFCYLDGQSNNRHKIITEFTSNDDIHFFLLSLKAGGLGLNLTKATIVIHFDQWWNPMIEDQANDRTHRIGQEQEVTSIKLVTKNSIEEQILSLQEKKRNLFSSLITQKSNFQLKKEDFSFLLQE